MSRAMRAAAVFMISAVLVALAALYFVGFLRSQPRAVGAVVTNNGHTADLTLQTVPSIGFGAHPDWVSYLVRDNRGHWVHSTIFDLPANAIINVTLYQFDTASGLRNPFWGKPQGTIGGTMSVNGKTPRVLDPASASHTFAIPQLGVSVPLEGIADNAPNQCSVAPCTLDESHNTVRFSFRTRGPGTFRWQCMVPCAFGFLFGFGGPMQTIGYMDGLLHVA